MGHKCCAICEIRFEARHANLPHRRAIAKVVILFLPSICEAPAVRLDVEIAKYHDSTSGLDCYCKLTEISGDASRRSDRLARPNTRESIVIMFVWSTRYKKEKGAAAGGGGGGEERRD